MKNIECQIKSFIQAIKEKYPNLNIGHEYEEEEDQYDIWHTDKDLHFHNDDFIEFAGLSIRKYFFDEHVFNISFGYNHQKFKEENEGKEGNI